MALKIKIMRESDPSAMTNVLNDYCEKLETTGYKVFVVKVHGYGLSGLSTPGAAIPDAHMLVAMVLYGPRPRKAVPLADADDI